MGNDGIEKPCPTIGGSKKVVDALTELHGKEQAMAFKMLGYPARDQVPSTDTGSLVNLDHLEIP